MVCWRVVLVLGLILPLYALDSSQNILTVQKNDFLEYAVRIIGGEVINFSQEGDEKKEKEEETNLSQKEPKKGGMNERSLLSDVGDLEETIEALLEGSGALENGEENEEGLGDKKVKLLEGDDGGDDDDDDDIDSALGFLHDEAGDGGNGDDDDDDKKGRKKRKKEGKEEEEKEENLDTDEDLLEGNNNLDSKSQEAIHLQESLHCIQSVWKDVLSTEMKSLLSLSSTNSSSSNNGKVMPLYPQFLSQFQDPLQRRERWLDQEFALTLRGLTVLANNPLMISVNSKASLSKLSRAVRLSPALGARITPSMLTSLVKALAASVHATPLLLTRKTIDLIRDRVIALAKEKHVNVPKSMLIRAHLLSVLFHLAAKENLPLVVAFSGDVSWITDSISVCDALITEIKNPYSTLFFLMLTTNPSSSSASSSSISSSDTSSAALTGDAASMQEQILQQLSELGINLPPNGFFSPQNMPPGATSVPGFQVLFSSSFLSPGLFFL